MDHCFGDYWLHRFGWCYYLLCDEDETKEYLPSYRLARSE
jgi:hypothetical protein